MKTYTKSLFAMIVSLLIFSVVLGSPFFLGSVNDADDINKNTTTCSYCAKAADSEPLGDFFVYLPLVVKRYPALPSVFGMQMSSITVKAGLNQVVEAQTKWVGGATINWSAVEPNEGDRNWQALANQEQQWENASANDLIPIAVVRYTPEWARKYPAYACGPMASEYFDKFADFMYEVVVKYSKSPYNIRYWQIWNEPDIDPSLVSLDSAFGCWGDIDDDYYGGGYYADMLKVVYPRIKDADANAQVLVGGLLLDCDPEHPPTVNSGEAHETTKDCTPAKFMQGILLNGGGPFFDGVSYHAYDYYLDALGQYANGNWHSAWNTTGPVIIAKNSYLQNLLDSSGFSDKFLINTESALLGDGQAGNSDFEQTKAYYLVQSYVIAMAEGLKGNLWYSLLGWRNSDLVKDDLSPLPAYHAYKFASQTLGSIYDVEEIGANDISSLTGLKGYKFDSVNGEIWVIWSMDGATHNISLSLGTPSAVYDVFGASQSASSTISVGLKPLYLKW